MRKRIISALLTLVMLLSLVPAVGTTAAAADSTGTVTVGPSDPAVTITIKGVQAGKLAQDVAYEVKYSDGTTGGAPYAPFDGVERKTPWQVKETGRYLLKNYIAYNGNTLADYDDHFYAGMTYKLVIAGNSVQFKGADKIKLVFEDCGIVSTSGAMQKETINDYTCYTLDVTLGGEMKTHGLKVDESIDHAYRRLENGTYEEISLTGDRTLQIPEGTKLKFTVDKDYMSDGGVLKFFKGFQTKIVNRKDREYSSKDKGFIEGNFKMLSRSGQEIILQMGDRDTSISAVFTDDQLVRLNAIYLDVLPAIENGRQVTVVTPSGEATRVAATPGLSSADKFATYTITGHTAGESNPNDNGVYLYKKSADPNTETDGKYTLDFSVKLNGNFYCSNRTTKLYINGMLVPEKDITQVTGFGDSDSLPVYWSIENRKIETLGCTGWDMDFRLRDFASQYYENTSRYGLGLDAPMDFKKASDGNYRYTTSDGNASKDIRAYGSFEAASGQSCTVTFPVSVPDGIRKWNANHSGEEKIGFSFRENATGGVFVQDAAGGSYSPVSATYTVSDPDSEGNVTATATFTPENGKLYRVMGSVAATWNGKIVATTPADNSFIYVKGVAKNYLTGSVVYTSAVRYGDNVSIGYTGGLGDIPGKHLQWQYLDGSEWKNIAGAPNGALPSAKVNSFVGQQIRVKVTADGYEGVIYSEPKKVGKGTNNDAPSAPQLTALEDATSTGTYTGFKIDNYDPNYEYVYSTSPITNTTTINWATNSISSDTVTSLSNDQTYYVYARARETATHLAGSKVSSSSVTLKAQNYLASITLSENGKAYAPYGVGNTIFIKVGEEKTLTVTGNPANANTWSDIYLRNNDTTSSHYSVTVDATDSNKIAGHTTEATAFSTHTVKIKGTSTGSGTLIASSLNSGSEGTVYGRWNVVVYSDESPVSPLTVELIDPPTYADVTLSVGDTYKPDGETPIISDIQTNPAGALSGYKVEWRVQKSGTFGSGPAFVTDNDYLSIDTSSGEITAKNVNTGGAYDKYVSLCVVNNDGNWAKTIATYSATVTAATAPTLESISVVPNEKTLKTGETVDLTAVKYPANAEGTISWGSSDSSKVTVTADTSDNSKATVQVASDATPGTYTITAECGGKQATCTVYVIDAGHIHSYGAWTYDDNFHYKTCTANDDTQAGPHNWTVTSTTPATLTTFGSISYKCDTCTATKTDVLSQLTAITDAGVSVTAPAYGDTPSGAYASSGEFSVASVDWQPAVSGTFAANTVYTVKVVLETTGSSRFTDATQFTINGQTATVISTIPDTGAETVTLTYQFPATGSGSSGGGGGSSTSSYAITVQGSKNGSVTADRKTASAGSTVTLTVSPDKGYTLETLTALDKSGKEIKLTEKNGKYTFTMPASNVEVEATFKAAKSGNPFVDVPSGAYYEDAVIWAVDKGVTGGTDATHFTPNGVCTRAQAVTFLWRAAGSPAPKSTAMPFTDVAAGSYYEQAVLWAVENGITKGTSDTTFSPNATCSRAQIVTFLWRSQKSPAAGSVNPFTDVSADAYYADAVLWAVKESVTSGTTATTFSPNADCTRAQIVTFIYRALAE